MNYKTLLLSLALLTGCTDNNYSASNHIVTECMPDIETDVINRTTVQGDSISLSYDYNKTIRVLFDHRSIVGTEHMYKQSFNILLPSDGVVYDRTLCSLDTSVMYRLTEEQMKATAIKLTNNEKVSCNDFFRKKH